MFVDITLLSILLFFKCFYICKIISFISKTNKKALHRIKNNYKIKKEKLRSYLQIISLIIDTTTHIYNLLAFAPPSSFIQQSEVTIALEGLI